MVDGPSARQRLIRLLSLVGEPVEPVGEPVEPCRSRAAGIFLVIDWIWVPQFGLTHFHNPLRGIHSFVHFAAIP
jgi:hypothetical protein